MSITNSHSNILMLVLKTFITMNFLQNFTAYIKTHYLFQQKDKLLIAVSGGADSTVLCELCKQVGYDFAIAHCNFKLRGEESDRDENFVRQLAEQYEVKIFVKEFDTIAIAKEQKTSIEETARNLRYDWFTELLKVNTFDWLLTAHHADDNIETVMMNFFRGTGVKGMRGILPKQKKIVRPLLFARRQEIENYAAQNNIAFVTDSTNAESDYTRNYFRNVLIPSIEKMYPETANNVLRNINRFADVEILYNESINSIKEKLVEKRGNERHIPVLKLVKAKPLHTVIYEIIAEYNFTAAQVGEVEKLLSSESGKYILSSTHRILRNRKWLIISPLNIVEEVSNYVIEKDETVILFAGGKLEINTVPKPESLVTTADTAFIDATYLKYPLLLRKWKQGDYFYPLGMSNLPAGRKGKKKLSRFFIDVKLSLTEKENVWVLESDKKIIWVVGHRIDDRFKVTADKKDVVRLHLFRHFQKN
jgi:tRNA(Ile)-lysidine synthase